MALIPSLSDIPDLTPVEGGQEYDLRVLKAQSTTSRNTGRNGILIVCTIIGEDTALNLMHTLWFGNDGKFTDDDEDKSNSMWRMVKDFVRSIGLDPDIDLEAEDFKDLEFSAILEYDDGIDPETNAQAFPPKNVLGRITG